MDLELVKKKTVTTGNQLVKEATKADNLPGTGLAVVAFFLVDGLFSGCLAATGGFVLGKYLGKKLKGMSTKKNEIFVVDKSEYLCWIFEFSVLINSSISKLSSNCKVFIFFILSK